MKFNARFHAGLHKCKLNVASIAVLDNLRAAGKMQSILSATKQSTLEETMRHFELEESFDHIYGIENDRAGTKLDRGRELIEVSGIQPSQTVMIGDTDHDLEVGNALGIDVILVDHGHQDAARLRRLHQQVISWE